MSKFTAQLLADAGVKPIVSGLPADVEICERSGSGRRIWIIINHGRSAQTVRLPLPVKDILVSGSSSSNGNGASSDGSSVGTIQLAAHDVAVVDVGAAESATP
jgi:beta-galactosidase